LTPAMRFHALNMLPCYLATTYSQFYRGRRRGGQNSDGGTDCSSLPDYIKTFTILIIHPNYFTAWLCISMFHHAVCHTW